MNYETAIAFVISIRPRMAVEDADAAARRLMNLNDPLATALDAQDFVRVALLSPAVLQELRYGRKIQAIKELRQLIVARWGINAPGGGAWLKEAKDAIENPRVAEAVAQ